MFKSCKKFALAVMVLSALSLPSAPQADASVGFGLRLAGGIGSGTAHDAQSAFTPGLGVEFDFGISGLLELGAFLDYNFLLDGSIANTGGSLLFYGALIRYYIVGSLGVFIDGQIGLTSASQNGTDEGTAVGFGFRLGSKLPLLGADSWNILPFAGVRILPYNVSGGNFGRTVFDFGFIIQFDLGEAAW